MKYKENIVFIVGASRSGTTMLSKILGKHSKIYTFEELHFFEELWTAEDKEKILSYDSAIELMGKLLYIQYDQGYLMKGKFTHRLSEANDIINSSEMDQWTKESVFHTFLHYITLSNGKQISCEQTPLNSYYIEDIVSIFPNAKIIAMIRDPRDVLLSQKNRWKVGKLGSRKIPMYEIIRVWLNYHPLVISKLWNSANQIILKYKEHNNVYMIRYEDILKNSENEVQRLCNFIGVDFESQQLHIPHEGSSNVAEQSDSLGIDAKRYGRWKQGLTKTEIFLCEKINSKIMKKFNYEPVNVKSNLLSLAVSYLIFIFKLPVALIFNLHKMKNLIQALLKRLS